MFSPNIVKDVQRLTKRLITLNNFFSKMIDRNLSFFKILRGAKRFKWSPKCEKAFTKLMEYLIKPSLFFKPKLEKGLFLYLAISLTMVSTTLISKEDWS